MSDKTLRSDDDQHNDEDMYDKLELIKGQKPGGFKQGVDSGLYYLPNGFKIPCNIYDNLFPH